MSIEPEPTIVYYRCVCGNDVNVDLESGGTCSQCNRTVSAAAVNADVTQTIALNAESLTPSVTLRTSGIDDSLVGEQLGHFRVVAPLGSGGMGSVYRATDESLQRFVALKVLSDTKIDRDDKEQLLQEARSQARVNNPHIVQVYYVSRDEERPFLAMEYVDGPSLLQKMTDTTLPFAEIVDVALQTADALEHSARLDIVHGDIKPANILLANGQTVKLSDFGLSRRMSAKSVPEEERVVSGTPSYMAPEITRGERATPQSDQYSLGVMLYQLTFNRLPFKEKTETVQEMIDAHRHKPVAFPKPWPANLPHHWRAVLQRLLAKEPRRRYVSYTELLDDLKRIRPLNLPTAGIVPRALAWSTDILLALLVLSLLLLPSQLDAVQEFMVRFPVVRYIYKLMIIGFGPLLGWIQAATGTTLGKKIFQIHIVNQHGLRPRPSKLFWRSIFQYLPVWSVAFAEVMRLFGLPRWADESVWAIPLAVILGLELLFIVFRRDRRSFHDWIFGTRVALDAAR